MKKLVFAVVAALSFSAFAADFVSVDVDHVKDTTTKQTSLAEYVRANKDFNGFNLGLQSRTARYADGSGMYNSLETYLGKSVGPVNAFVGVGYDNAKNGAPASQYDYGLAGIQGGVKAGPGFAFGGVKTRLNWNDANPKQTVAYATYSIPVASKVSLNLNASRSYQDITEKALGVGVSVGF